MIRSFNLSIVVDCWYLWYFLRSSINWSLEWSLDRWKSSLIFDFNRFSSFIPLQSLNTSENRSIVSPPSLLFTVLGTLHVELHMRIISLQRSVPRIFSGFSLIKNEYCFFRYSFFVVRIAFLVVEILDWRMQIYFHYSQPSRKGFVGKKGTSCSSVDQDRSAMLTNQVLQSSWSSPFFPFVPQCLHFLFSRSVFTTINLAREIIHSSIFRVRQPTLSASVHSQHLSSNSYSHELRWQLN